MDCTVIYYDYPSSIPLATEYTGGTTNTMEAFRIARTTCFNPANGDRSYAPNVAIIITDGQPTAYIDPTGQVWPVAI